MKPRVLGTIIMLSMLVVGGPSGYAAIRATVDASFTFEDRFVRLILPSNLDTEEGLIPLVLHLHGAVPLENIADLELANSGYRDLPGQYKVIVAAPAGTKHPESAVGGLYFWNATEACCGFELLFEPQVDDAGYLNRLLDELLARYPIDPQRVYIYGYSNGGFMAYRMACDYAERFAAIAVVAGATFQDPSRCTPTMPVSVLHLHGTADETVPFNGGNFTPYPVTAFPGAIDTVEQWGLLDGCGELQFGKKARFDLRIDLEGKEAIVNRFEACPEGIDVEFWSLEGGNHSSRFFGDSPSGIKTLTEKTWKFLQKHVR